MEQSPYVFEESEGLMHIKLRGDASGQCRACVRKDAYEIVRQESYREGYNRGVQDCIAKVGGKG